MATTHKNNRTHPDIEIGRTHSRDPRRVLVMRCFDSIGAAGPIVFCRLIDMIEY